MLKGRTSRILRKEFPELKKWCNQSLWAPSCYHRSVGHGWGCLEIYSEYGMVGAAEIKIKKLISRTKFESAHVES